MGPSANSTETDQKPQNAASDQVLHCLLTENSIKNENYQPTTNKTEIDGSICYWWEIPFGLNGLNHFFLFTGLIFSLDSVVVNNICLSRV